jgi:multiple sugar transport system ATP-binding protein
MGRAIVREPQVFLMDEPLSNLDARLRAEMRVEIANLQRRLGVTTMYVTHDQLEAMTMGTRIAVLRDGTLQQCGAPQALYDEPDNLFVATFIGSPPMNVLPGRLEREGEMLSCVVAGQRLPLDAHTSAPLLQRPADRAVLVGVRAEHLTEATGPAVEGRPRLRGRVRFAELLGAEQLVRVELGEGTEAAVVTARLDAHARVALGSEIELLVKVDEIRLFDPVSGRSIR